MLHYIITLGLSSLLTLSFKFWDMKFRNWAIVSGLQGILSLL